MEDSTDVPTTTIFELESFEEFVSVIRKHLRCEHWLFRGLKDKNYKLIPTLGRMNSGSLNHYEYEARMIRETFSDVVDQGTGEHTDINQLLLAQHHGAPTRLLDWSASAMVAAYFASEEVQEDADFSIVAAHVCPQTACETHFNVDDLRDVEFYSGYLDASYNNIKVDGSRWNLKDELDNRGTIFIKGSEVSPRVSAQQGLVSVQKELTIPIDEQFSQNITNFVHLHFTSAARLDFQDMLFKLGVRRRSIFPDIDSLFGAYGRERLIQDRLSDQCNSIDLESGTYKLE